MKNEAEVNSLIEKAVDGDEAAMTELLSRYRSKLTQMVRLRMDHRLSTRVDASDVVQEATLEASRRLGEYVGGKDVDFFLWLRWIANDRLIDAYRFHVGAQKRQVGQEVSIFARPMAAATSFALAEHLLGRVATPSAALRSAETKLTIENALNELDPIDREVLVLRHFEHLSNKETAEVLGLKKSGASRRYVVALTRLKDAIGDLNLFDDEG